MGNDENHDVDSHNSPGGHRFDGHQATALLMRCRRWSRSSAFPHCREISWAPFTFCYFPTLCKSLDVGDAGVTEESACPLATRSLLTVTKHRWVMAGAALCKWGTSGVPLVPVGPRKVHISDVFPCPQWGRAGKWGKGAVVPPERATVGQNWRWSWKWTPGREGSFPAAVPGENFLLPLAVNCKSDWATDGKCWGKPEKGEVKNFGRDFVALRNQF